MARIESLAVLLTTTGKDYLSELYGAVIGNIQSKSISSTMKNMSLSGDPTSGSVEAKRFANATVNQAGTARANGAGAKVKAKPVTVAIDVDRELMEEVEEKDVKLYGVDAFVEKRVTNHYQRMLKDLEKSFFSEASGAGLVFTTSLTDAVEKVEAALQQVEVTKNDFIDGIDRDMMTVVASPAVYGALATAISKQQNASFDSSVGIIESFNGAKVEKSTDLPVGVEFMVIVDEAVAQPVMFNLYAPSTIPLSNATAFGIFYNYGTQAVAPDTILVKTSGVLALTNVAGATGKAKVTASVLSGATQYYKTAATVAEPAVGSLYSALTGFAAFVSGTEYTATSTHDFVVIEVNDAGEVIRSGKIDSVVVG